MKMLAENPAGKVVFRRSFASWDMTAVVSRWSSFIPVGTEQQS